jgi:5-methylthioadenosine/S-adenosylhomocysteine deaminase
MTSNRSCFRTLQEPRKLLIKNAKTIICSKGSINAKSILVSGRRIAAIGEKSKIRQDHGSWEIELDASNCLVMPGFVNNHSHIAMSLLRGMAEDLPLFNWLRDKIWPIEAKLKPWQIEIGAALGAVEALLAGTTTVNTNYIYDRIGSEASALKAVGMRAAISHGIFDWTREKGLRATEDLCTHFHGADEGRIRVATSPHSAYTCSPDLLKNIETLRRKLNEKNGKKYPILNTLHVAESSTEAEEIKSKYAVDAKRGVANYLYSLGVLNQDTICAHSIHLTEDDYLAFRNSHASIASCPISNLKVGVGVADLPRAISEGITVSLGTDGPASNNTLDMFETTKMASLLAKGLKGDTTQLGSEESFLLATFGGAKSLHQENDIGGIFEGAKADLVLMDLSNISALPFYNPFNYITYSARSRDVRDVLVDGRILVRNGKVQTINLENLRERISLATTEIASDFCQKIDTFGA